MPTPYYLMIRTMLPSREMYGLGGLPTNSEVPTLLAIRPTVEWLERMVQGLKLADLMRKAKLGVTYISIDPPMDWQLLRAHFREFKGPIAGDQVWYAYQPLQFVNTKEVLGRRVAGWGWGFWLLGEEATYCAQVSDGDGGDYMIQMEPLSGSYLAALLQHFQSGGADTHFSEE